MAVNVWSSALVPSADIRGPLLTETDGIVPYSSSQFSVLFLADGVAEKVRCPAPLSTALIL